MIKQTLLACVLANAATVTAVAAQEDSFTIGLSGAITGPTAGSYAPAIEGIRIYIERLNAAGGIDGTPVELILQDDQGEASKAAANAARLAGQERVDLMINASLSSTFAPMIAQARRNGVPMLFASSVCPEEVYPPEPTPGLYCTTAFAAQYDSRATLDYLEEISDGDIDLGLLAMGIPVSRSEIDYAEEIAGERGMNVVRKEVTPPATSDYGPFASNLTQSGANWVYGWAPWVAQVKTFEALQQLGWEGDFLGWAHLEAEGEMQRLQAENLHLVGATALFAEDLPIHQEIRDAVEEVGSDYPAEQMAEGWIGGMAIEAALRKAGSGADSAAITEAMSDLTIDTEGLRGGPIIWTADNHFRTEQHYRVYRWQEGGIENVTDWQTYAVE